MTAYSPPRVDYLGPAKFYGDKTNKPIRRLVIHATVSPCVAGGAVNVAHYFREDVVRPSSAHYIVDPSEAVQVVYDSWVAYHAPPNAHSLGLELCDPMTGPAERWKDLNHRRMLRRAARLTAQLCLAYDIPPRKIGPAMLRENRKGVCGHVDVARAFGQSDHTDPGVDFPWRAFMAQVRCEYETIRASL